MVCLMILCWKSSSVEAQGSRCWVFGLLVMPYPHLNPIVFQKRRNIAHIRLAIVIREQHLRFDHPRRIDELLDGHRVGLVTGEEGNIDVLDVGHFGDVLGVASDIDFQAIQGEDEAVVPTFGVELLVAFRGVVGGYGLHGEVVGQLERVAVSYHLTVTERFGAALVGD